MEDNILLLDTKQIEQKLERIACEIVENNFDEKKIILCGIRNRGYFLAEKLVAYLKEYGSFKVSLTSIKLDKRNPIGKDIEHDIPEKEIMDGVIIMVDDVVNTGRTLYYAMKPLMDHLPRKVRIAVLVDRKHKTFPVCADYVGLSLSTTMREHVHLETKKLNVFLA